MNDGQIPNVRGVRVHVSTSYNRVEGNRRASRNGLVSSSPTPETPTVTIRKRLRRCAAVRRLPGAGVRRGQRDVRRARHARATAMKKLRIVR